MYMENKNTVVILLVFIIGLIIGYFFGVGTFSRGYFMGDGHGNMHEHMYDHMMNGDWQEFMMEDGDARAYMLEHMNEFLTEDNSNE